MPDADQTASTRTTTEAAALPPAAPALIAHVLPAPSVGPLPPIAGPGAVGPATLRDTALSIMRHEPQHGAYLAASGTLTQFNALVIAILTAALAAIDRPLLRAAIGVALIAHTCAAFLLCWAARPAAKTNGASGEDMAADTFKSYGRGWRVTMIAMALSAAALVIFSFDTLGGAAPFRSLLAR
jgi:hypothetical protein